MAKISFLANLAGVNTAARPITFGIEGDSKIVLEADAQQQLAVITLLALGKARLQVDVSVDENEVIGGAQ